MDCRGRRWEEGRAACLDKQGGEEAETATSQQKIEGTEDGH